MGLVLIRSPLRNSLATTGVPKEQHLVHLVTMTAGVMVPSGKERSKMFEEKQKVVTDAQIAAAQKLLSSRTEPLRNSRSPYTKKQKGSKRAPRIHKMRGPAYAHRKKQSK